MKYIYFVLGLLCVVIGGIGVVLPILPTAPFLLVAAFCFARSSERFYQWLVHTSMYQKHLGTAGYNRTDAFKKQNRHFSRGDAAVTYRFLYDAQSAGPYHHRCADCY